MRRFLADVGPWVVVWALMFLGAWLWDRRMDP